MHGHQQMNSNSLQHMMYNQNRDQIKMENNFGMNQGNPQNNMYYGNQPNSYFQQQQQQPQQQQQNHPGLNHGYPQSPSSPHPMHNSQNYLQHQMHHNVPSPSHPPQSPAQMSQSSDQGFNSNSVNLNDLGSLSTGTLLEKIYKLQRSQKDDLNKIRQYQKQVMVSPNKQAFDVLDQQHRQMKEQIDTEVKALQRLYTQVVLQPSEIHRLLLLVQELKIQQTQLELFHQELHQLAQSHGPTRW